MYVRFSVFFFFFDELIRESDDDEKFVGELISCVLLGK